jgi:anhydro-N-acetylmuramic acid kinase
MHTDRYSLIGLMSGTSGDGLDLAYCQFEWLEGWKFEIVEAVTISFPADLGKKLARAHLLSALDLALLDLDFGRWMGEKVRDFCQEKEIQPMAVASHGHTVFHQPEKGLSLQIGNGWALHQASGQKVINDFRMKDIQLGGQGAPLVPIGDRLLFPQIDFCLNLGGISNISMENDGKRIAFDTSPFNLLLNAEAAKLGLAYDAGGEIARSGRVNQSLLDALNALPFYEKVKAKSLGREDMEQVFAPLIGSFELSPADAMATLVEHFAFQIAKVIQQFSSKTKPSVLITGGGAYHSYFIERLDAYLNSNWEKFNASAELIEFKEALIFAFLGALRLKGEPNALASVTGASSDSCGGVIYG